MLKLLIRSQFMLLFVVILFGRCHQPMDTGKRNLANDASRTVLIDSQKEINKALIKKISTADSILLTSHTGTTIDHGKGNFNTPELVINNRMNTKIIREKQVLSGTNLDTLIKILSMPTNNDSTSGAHCCDPHHSIFIFNKKEISYLDLCFHCNCLFTSKDLSLIVGYEQPKWKALLAFFKKLGFRYEIPET